MVELYQLKQPGSSFQLQTPLTFTEPILNQDSRLGPVMEKAKMIWLCITQVNHVPTSSDVHVASYCM